MKVLIINGSPRKEGNTSIVIKEMVKIFNGYKIDVVVQEVGNLDIRGCIACGYCKTHGECVFKDIVNETVPLLKEADGVIITSPVYYASPNGTVISFMDRLFQSCNLDLRMKVGASFAVARRSGTTASFDVLNKYFTIHQMPIASSRYWNNAYGLLKGEAQEDFEGLQTARILARNMAFLMRSIELGKKEFGLPETEEKTYTHFIK